MIDGLALHDSTLTQVRNFIAAPVHAVLLTGPDGIGKTAIAEALITTLLQLQPNTLSAYPHYNLVTPVNGTVPIETVRELQKFLQLKTIGTNPLRRAILVEHAQGMTTEAQNAFLKLLEEPPADTLLVLTADTPRALLPTIMSRVQAITVHVPSGPQLQPMLLASGKDEATLKQAVFLSGGLPGLLTALITGDEAHPLLSSVAEAKAILQKTPFERLAMVDALSKQKDTAKLVVEALGRIAEAMLAQAAAKGEAVRIKQWHRIRTAALETHEALDRSANAKLALSSLFLHL
ncbi:MAG TPA: AAA family ATPase, partial [Candidatus Saccharimonadales bacterium]|jgi:DNA polymerase-3 subunit delta'|nr:AAA family ATPase [Candidatus Saccharimonadales bacterium]